MYLYFSGTGNSYAAASVAGDCCELMNITECMDKECYSFPMEADEPFVFFCPVHYGGIPKLAAEYIERLSFEGRPAYICLVLTYSDHYGRAAVQFADLLAKKGLSLDAFYAVRMPENNVIDRRILPEEERDELYEKAEEVLREISAGITAKEKIPAACEPGYVNAEARYALYLDMCRTGHFYVDDQCVSCVICATRCPYHSIRLIDGVPTWTRDQCTLCMGCMRCGAIHYDDRALGKKTC